MTRTAPVVSRPVGPGLALRSGGQQRILAQAGLVGVLLLAFAAIAVARFPGDDGGALLAPTASVLPTPTPTPTPSPSPSPTIEVTPSPTPEPTPSPTPTPAPTIPTTSYRVVSGDTLSGIAARFHTTVKAIMDLNQLTTTSLRVGQLLQIPVPAA